MNKKIWIGLIAVLLIAVVVFVTQKKESLQQEKIKIGAILPLTGDAAQWGIPPHKGAQLAIEEINNQGGIRGKQLVLVVEDSTASVKEGVSAFNKLLIDKSINVILGPVASSVTLAIAPIAERNKITVISPASTNPKITEAGDYIFRVVPSDSLRGKVFADYLFNDKAIRSIAIIYINNDSGIGIKQSFTKRFIELGGKVLLEEGYKQGTVDLRTAITKIKNSKAESVVCISFPQDTIVLLKQMKELAIGLPLFFATEAVEDASVLREAGGAAEGVIYILPASAKGIAAENFAKAYQQKYNSETELFAAEAYDIIHLIANAIKANPDSEITPNIIKSFLYQTKGYAGASGMITFDSNGDVLKPMAIKTILNGQPTLVKEQ